MIAQLPAYLNAVMGSALSYELIVLVVLGLMITIRQNLYRGLRWFRTSHEEPTDRLRSELWKILRGN